MYIYLYQIIHCTSHVHIHVYIYMCTCMYILQRYMYICTGICHIFTSIHSTELRVGFIMSSYTASEDEKDVEVCISVARGELGTDITLQVDTVDGTALGE